MSKSPSIFGGAMIIAGTAIGAGMLANPTATAGVWFSWSLLLFAYTWLCMYASGLMILEASTTFSSNANLSTIVKSLLGNGWNTINSLSLVFVLYVLLYAYITSGGGLTASHLSALTGTEITPRLGSLVISVLFAVFVWLSTQVVDRVASILMIGMMVSFFISVFGMMPSVSPDILFDTHAPTGTAYTPYIWVALSTVLVSFGYHIGVPSMVKYFAGDTAKVAKSVLIGSLMALTFYLLWQVVVQGNLPRTDFAPVIAKDGDVATLLGAIGKSGFIGTMLGAFAYMALVSSFLGVALGLFDFLSDVFGFGDDKKGRAYAVALVFLPPLVLSLIAPFGFTTAIGFAGLALTVWGVIVPALLAKAHRQKYPNGTYRVFGGQFMIYFVIIFGVINIVAQIGGYLGMVPSFGG